MIIHILVIRFKKPIVGDRHEWSDTKKISDGYRIHERSKDISVSEMFNEWGTNSKSINAKNYPLKLSSFTENNIQQKP